MKDRIPGIILAAVIGAAAIWLFLHTKAWDHSMLSFENRLDPINTTIPESVHQRAFLDNDPYYWLTYAGEMIEHGTWRIRYTYADNPPDGRPVHWSQSVSWIMVLYGSARKMITGQTWPSAIEDAAIWINPTLQIQTAGNVFLDYKFLGIAPSQS
jgi:asparagine N-glycosylation enzyme membrane subunit Stt3